MSRAGDLASVLGDGKPGPPGVGIRQGIVVSFDIFAGTSTVNVGGAILTDVPLMSTAAQVYLKAGDSVILLRNGSSWTILGRSVVPGGIAAIGRFFELTGTYSGATSSGYALTTSFVTRCSLAIPIPSWAEVATITASLGSQGRNTSGVADAMQGRILYPDGNMVTMTGTSVASGGAAALTNLASCNVHGHYQMYVTPGGTLTLEGQPRTLTGGWAANGGNAAFLQATVAWNSNDGP